MDTMVQILMVTATSPAINPSEAITADLPGHNRDRILALGCRDARPTLCTPQGITCRPRGS